MPSFNLNGGVSTDDQIAYMKRTLNWLMQNLDHLNVKQLYTEYCNIQSENGETEISGPVITMKDGEGTVRLGMGYNGEDFSFNMYDAAGNIKFYADSDTGDLYYGGTLRTSFDNTGRIEIDSTYGLVQYNNSNQKTLQIVSNSNVSSDYGRIMFWNAGNIIGWIEGQPTGYRIVNYPGVVLSLGYDAAAQIEINGIVDCTSAKFSNLKDNSEHDYVTDTWVNSQGFLKTTSGWSGTFTAGTKTVTVVNGLITNVA